MGLLYSKTWSRVCRFFYNSCDSLIFFKASHQNLQGSNLKLQGSSRHRLRKSASKLLKHCVPSLCLSASTSACENPRQTAHEQRCVMGGFLALLAKGAALFRPVSVRRLGHLLTAVPVSHPDAAASTYQCLRRSRPDRWSFMRHTRD